MLGVLASEPLIGLLIAAVLTWAAHSSVVTVLLARGVVLAGATLAVHEYSVRDSRIATAMWAMAVTAFTRFAADSDLPDHVDLKLFPELRQWNHFEGTTDGDPGIINEPAKASLAHNPLHNLDRSRDRRLIRDIERDGNE